MEQKCPFCRRPSPDTDEEVNKNLMKRIEANDPVAMCQWVKFVAREGTTKVRLNI